jgi:undecaprenyl-diphosphatase
VQAVLTWLGGLEPAVIYLVAAFVVFAETGLLVGLVVPGEATLFVVGFLAYSGTLRLPAAVAVMVAAGLAGDAMAFVQGRRMGPRVRASRFGQRVGSRRWARADALLTRYGGRAVGVGRFIAFIRTLTPRLAGMAGLSYWRVLPWDLLGTLGWVGGSVVVGYLAGSSYAQAATIFGRATEAVLLLSLIIVALAWIGRYLGRNRDPVAVFGARLAGARPLRWLHTWYLDAFGWLAFRVGPGGAVAVNLVLGAAGLLIIGVTLTWLIDHLVRRSGIPLIDPPIADWFAARRTPAARYGAEVTLSVLRGSFLILAVAVVGVALNPRPRAWLTDLLGVLGTAGAFVPLLILALAADWVRPDVAPHAVLPNQVTVVTAGFGMLGWLLARRVPWAVAIVVWLVAFGGVLLTVGASLYLGRAWPSELVGSVLLGSLWVLVFAIAWHTRDRVPAEGQSAPVRHQNRVSGDDGAAPA